MPEIQSGGTLNVGNGGLAVQTSVAAQGTENLLSGGAASGTTVHAGGVQNVWKGGSTASTLVESGGTQNVYASAGPSSVSTVVVSVAIAVASAWASTSTATAGIANTSTVAQGGSVTASTLAQTTAVTTPVATAVVSTSSVTTGSTSSVVVSNVTGGVSGTTVLPGGNQNVFSGGVVTGTFVGGGTQTLASGASAIATTVDNGGTQTVLSGGQASGTTLNANAVQNVLQGGAAVATQVNDGGTQNVYAGFQVTSTTTVVTGVYPPAAPGLPSAGYAYTVLTYVTGTTASVSGTTVFAGGRQNVFSGGAATDTFLDGGVQTLASAASANVTRVANGGTQIVQSGAYASDTTVTSGTAVVDGTAANVTLNAAAVLTGVGRIASDLTLNSGSTLAAATPGAGLTVAGALAFATGSTYAVTLASTATSGDASNASSTSGAGGTGSTGLSALAGVTTVTGNVAIAPGTTLVLTAQPGAYTPGMKVAIVKYGGTESGSFDTIRNDFVYVVPTLSYDAGEIAVTLVISPTASFASVAQTRNQAAVGQALTTIYRAGGNDVTTALLSASATQARDALTQLAGDETPAFRQIAERRMDQAQAVIGDRLGAAASTTAGTAAATSAPSTSAQSAASGNAAPAADPSTRPQHEWWVQASYQNARTAGNDVTGAGAYLDRSAALTIGHDRAIAPSVRVGGAVMFNDDTVNFSDRSANGRVDGAQALLYGSFTPADRPVFVNAIAGYGWWENTLSRQLTLGTLSGNARGSFDTTAASLYAEAGLNLASAIGAVQPYVGAKVGRYQQQGYAEGATSGTNVFDLRYGGAHAVAASSLLGVRVKHDGAALFGHGFDWRMDVAWQHRFGPGDSTVQAAFVDAPTIGYQVGGTKMDHDALRTTLGVKWALNRTTSLYVNAGMSLGATTQAYAGNAGVQWRW